MAATKAGSSPSETVHVGLSGTGTGAVDRTSEALIRDFVSYGEARQKFERFGGKLEVTE
jgi:hypothetical protein